MSSDHPHTEPMHSPVPPGSETQQAQTGYSKARGMYGRALEADWRNVLINIWLLLSAIVILLSVVGHMQIGMSNDHLDLTDATKRMLAGAVPYVDWVDVNPPMIHFVYTTPVLISQWTGVPLVHILNLFTLSLIALSVLISYKVLYYSQVQSTARWVIVSSVAVALLMVSFIHQPFGDREHLMVTMAAPWFVLYSPLVRRESVPLFWRMLTALIAGVGFAIKPYFYVFYIASVGYWLLAGQSFRRLLKEAEHYVVGGIAVLYLIAILTYFNAWLYEVVPLASKTYWAINWLLESKIEIIQNELLGKYALPGLVGIVLIWLVSPALYSPAVTYLLLLLLAGIGSYLLNGGWYYTQYPFMAIAWVFLTAVGAALVSACELVRHKLYQRACLLSLCGIGATILTYSYILPAIDRASWDSRLTRERGHTLVTRDIEHGAAVKVYHYLNENPKFIFLATNLWGVNLQAEGSPVRHVSRFDFLWFLPGIIEMKKQPYRIHEVQELMRYLAESLAEDIERHKPDLILSDISPAQRALPPHYNIMPDLMPNERFAKAMEDYYMVERVDACNQYARENCAYEIYLRKKP